MSKVIKLEKKIKNKLDKVKAVAMDTRQTVCPVRNERVTEYLIPQKWVGTDQHSQNRDKDSSPNIVSQIAEEISNVGQNLGICCEVKEIDGQVWFIVRWGNTRLRSVTMISVDENYKANRQIPGMKQEDCVWVSIYDKKPSELRRLQAKENNVHPTACAANKEDNVRSMKNIIADGILDYSGTKWKDCDDIEKKERVKKEVMKTMPHFGGRKFGSFWAAFRSTTEDSFQVKSWDRSKTKSHFIKNNPFGILSMDEMLPEKTRTIFNTVYKVDGKTLNKKIGIQWFSSKNAGDGAYFQGSFSAKYVDKTADEMVWVVAVSPGQSVTLKQARDNIIKVCKSWNSELPGDMKFVDRILFLPPNTTREGFSQALGG